MATDIVFSGAITDYFHRGVSSILAVTDIKVISDPKVWAPGFMKVDLKIR